MSVVTKHDKHGCFGETLNQSLSQGDLLSLGLRSANGPGAEMVK